MAIAGAQALEDARDDGELAQRLQEFFAPIAPTAQVFPSSTPPAEPAALAPPEDDKAKLVRWRNVGFGQQDEGQGARGPYYRTRDSQRPKDGKPRDDWALPAETYEAELVPGITARVPTVLWRDADGTLPHGAVPASWCPLPENFLMSADDRRTRLAAVVLGWNVFQHFYPYFDVTEVDWPKELERALTAAATDADPWAFQATLQRMIAALHDGHGAVFHANEARGLPEVCWGWVEGELAVLAPSPDGRLARGDVVVSLDGVTTKMAFEREAQLLSAATPQYLRYASLSTLGAGALGTKARLAVRSPAGDARELEVARGRAPEEPRPAKIAELEPALWYVDLGRIEDSDFDGALQDLARAKGIVFDLRGYPRVSPQTLAHLIDEPIESAQWLVPQALLPDRKATTFVKSSWKVEPTAPQFTAKVAFLTDGRAISYAETFLGMVEHYGLAPIVGEPTAGTNGNVNPFPLPGSYTVWWTGMKVLKQDGSRHHGIGIQPTVPCARTLAGVAAGRDEQLEKALALVR